MKRTEEGCHQFSSICITVAFVVMTAIKSASVADEIPSRIDLATNDYTDYLVFEGIHEQDQVGLSVCAGDFDGDGLKDVVICTHHGYHDLKRPGTAYIVFTSPEFRTTKRIPLDTNTKGIVKISGESDGDDFGVWSAPGDYNGDGICDLALGAWLADPLGRRDAGKLYIFFGSYDMADHSDFNLSTDQSACMTVIGKESGDRLGLALESGDVNGDGINDIIAGAQYADPHGRNDAGEAYVILGSQALDESVEIDLRNPPDYVVCIQGYGYTFDYGDNAGWAVAMGDLDGDGFDEAIVGSRFADPDDIINAGETYVLFGRSDFSSFGTIDLANPPNNARLIILPGCEPHDYTGNALSTGDLNGDGFEELQINAYAVDVYGRQNAGRTYVIPGSSDISMHGIISLSDPPVSLLTLSGENSEDHLGPTSTGDFNGDGYMDLLQGCLNNDPNGRVNAGTAYIVYGSEDVIERGDIDLRNPPDDITVIKGPDAGCRLGLRNNTGDIDGDGLDDAIISCHAASPGGRNMAGTVYILWGKGEGGGGLTPNLFTYDANTGNNAIILITASNPPTISGEPLSVGDKIGVFTPGGLCAGSGIWRGENLTITVWGDNQYADGINGFLDGEQYTFRIRDISMRRDVVAHAEYGQGDGVYHIDGISILSSLVAEETEVLIPLAAGWNLVSSPVVFGDVSMSAVWESVIDRLTLVKNGAGDVFWPQYGIDNIGVWDFSEGYQVYMTGEGELGVSGFDLMPADITYTLPKGWSLVSYTGIENMSPGEAFAALDDRLILVKNGAGEVYWPSYEIDQLEAMHRGEGYWVCLSAPGRFTYPAVIEKRSTFAARHATMPVHFTPPANTGSDATLLVPTDIAASLLGTMNIESCEIAVFTESGHCAGAGVIRSGANLAIAVRGDNELTDEVEGFSPGEQYRLVIRNAAADREITLEASFSGSECYMPNGITVVESVRGVTQLSHDGTEPRVFRLAQNTPNPFNPVTTISFSLPRECRATLNIYDVTGAKVAMLTDGILPAGEHSVTWDASGYPSGIYLSRLEAGGMVATRKMLLVK